MATDMYLTIDNITGESQREGHEGEIEVLSWTFGGSNSSTVGVGSGGGAGRVNLNDISITKYLDAASAELFQAMCDGTHFETGKLTVYKAGGSAGALPYLTLDFEEMFPTSMSTGGSGGQDVLTESVSFKFGKVTVTYTKQSDDGTAEGDYVGAWDIRRVTSG